MAMQDDFPCDAEASNHEMALAGRLSNPEFVRKARGLPQRTKFL